MRKGSVLVILCACLTLASCSGISPFASGLSKHKTVSVGLFDTYVEITAYTASEEVFNLTAGLIIEMLEHLNRQFDIYNEYEGVNNLKTVNDLAGISPVAVSHEIIELIVFAKQAYHDTGGTVNAALGPVLNIWHDYREAGTKNPEQAELPDISELRAAWENTDMNDVVIDEANSTVFLSKTGMSLDVGALAKGFAAQKAIRLAEELGLTSCLIDFGGNVVTLGRPEDGNRGYWSVGVQSPDESGEIFDILNLNGQSAVTSGDYQRYYEVGSVRYHHIIDPETLMPANTFKAVTVIASDSGIADMLSTALFIRQYEEGEKLAEMFGAAAIWIYADGTAKVNSEYKKISKTN